MNLTDTIRVHASRAKDGFTRSVDGFRNRAYMAAAVAAVALLSAQAARADMMPITVTQADPVYNATTGRVSLYQDKVITQGGITLDSAEDGSLAGLLESIWSLTDINGVPFNQRAYAGDFDAFVLGRHFGYGVVSGDDRVDTGWSAAPNADFSSILLTASGRNKDIWDSDNPLMNTIFAFDLAAIDRDYDGVITPGIEGIAVGPEVVSDGFVGNTTTGGEIPTATSPYSAIPEPATVALLAAGAGLYLLKRRD